MSQAKKSHSKSDSMVEKSKHSHVVAPLVDVYESEEEILLFADMPGVKKEDININIEHGKLVIAGIRNLEISGSVCWEEFVNLEYQRSFSVPQTIAVGKVNAELIDGVLKLQLPKMDIPKPIEIEIQHS